jgi:hypothetical protein
MPIRSAVVAWSSPDLFRASRTRFPISIGDLIRVGGLNHPDR